MLLLPRIDGRILDQIGWIGDNNNVNTPEPKMLMEEIFVDVDTKLLIDAS